MDASLEAQQSRWDNGVVNLRVKATVLQWENRNTERADVPGVVVESLTTLGSPVPDSLLGDENKFTCMSHGSRIVCELQLSRPN